LSFVNWSLATRWSKPSATMLRTFIGALLQEGAYRPRRGKRALWGPAAPVPDFTALRGDPSDQIPGMRGVGPKGAAMLLRRYGTLEQALAEGRRHEQSDELRRYKRIATMDPQCCFPS
jgi:hypothetical protein